MPANLIGAYVVYYASASNHLDAVKQSVVRLTAEGYVFQDIHGQVRQLDPVKWTEYVEDTWSEFKEYLPSQEEVLQRVEAGQMFNGPFCGYETE